MISVEHLVKCYGNFKAVDDLTFDIEDGHIYGFLGPNGAGKSTTMNIMTGCLSPTGGTVTIDGLDIFEDAKAAKKHIGYLPEIPPVYTDSTPYEFLRFVAKAKGIAKKDLNNQIESVISETGLKDVENRLIKNLSKGYRQRVGIAQALLGNPSVIILDEPTVGLDPSQIIEIRTLIKELGEKHTVILSSHILSEVQAICEKVLIISNGKLIAFDTPDNLEKLFLGKATVQIKAGGNEETLMMTLKEMDGVDNYEVSQYDDMTTGVRLESSSLSIDELSRIVFEEFSKSGLIIYQLNPVKASLEDVFIELTKDDPLTANQISINILSEDEISDETMPDDAMPSEKTSETAEKENSDENGI